MVAGAPGREPAEPGQGRGGGSRRGSWIAPVPVFLATLRSWWSWALPFLHVRFNAPDASILPPYVPSRVAYDTLVADVPGR